MKLENVSPPDAGKTYGTADAVISLSTLRRGKDYLKDSKKIYLGLVVNDFFDGEYFIDENSEDYPVVYIPKAWGENNFSELNGKKAVTAAMDDSIKYELTFKVSGAKARLDLSKSRSIFVRRNQ